MATKNIKFGMKYHGEKSNISSPTGEKTEIRHEPYITEDGRRILKPTKKVPIYELIQVGREETEIERIVKRAMEGDYNALNAMNGVYTDITDAPQSLAQAQQLIINAKKEFNELPTEIKKEFEYNPEIYVASVGTKDWFDKMGITAAQENQKKLKEAEKKFKADQAKAMENLAANTGQIIKNTEVKIDE